MSDYYKGKIKVVAGDKMCFPVNPETLEPLACSLYDPYAWSDPEWGPIETISIEEYRRRKDQKVKQEQQEYIKKLWPKQ
jgi:hypothetical protein